MFIIPSALPIRYEPIPLQVYAISTFPCSIAAHPGGLQAAGRRGRTGAQMAVDCNPGGWAALVYNSPEVKYDINRVK